VLAEVDGAAGGDPRLDAAVKQLRADLAQPLSEAAGRQVATRLALALQGSLLVRYAPAPVADAFCATRLGPDGPAAVFGLGVPDATALVDRAAPTR
jgi:putative acyl-CoA dehydrogenase